MYRIKAEGSPAALASFAEGQFYIQDPSTMASVQELDPRPGENILDLCAAPGGKTTAIAQRMQDDGAVLAIDIDERRLDLLRDNAERLGVSCIQPKALAQIAELEDRRIQELQDDTNRLMVGLGVTFAVLVVLITSDMYPLITS